VNYLRLMTTVLFACQLLSTTSLSYAEQSKTKEYYIKAAFIYNFARLVTWPDTAFTGSNQAMRICLTGDTPFADALIPLSKKKAHNRSLLIASNVTSETLTACHILFIDSSHKKHFAAIIRRLKKHYTLTISAAEGFAQQGGHIRLYLNKKNTHSLEINLQAIKSSGLKISSRILSLADIVRSAEAVQP